MTLAQLIARTGEQEAVIQVLCHLMSADRTAVFLVRDIDEDIAFKTIKYIEQYKKGTPLAYLLGYTYFYNHKFVVNRNVLVPRPDTEILVEMAEKKLIAESIIGHINNPYKVLDLCCGSGAIGISLALLCDWLMKKEPKELYDVTLADISERALDVAEANARLHDVDVNIIQSDLLTDIKGCFDFVVCNPPYVRTFDIGVEDPRVLQEPQIALNGGIDGLYFYRKILTTIRPHLSRDAMIMFEVGYDQALAVQEIALKEGFSSVRIYKDLANHDRVVTMRK